MKACETCGTSWDGFSWNWDDDDVEPPCFCDLDEEPEIAHETAEQFQKLIDTGMAWRLEGSVGREAMALIESGDCILGEQGHHDFWGNYVPSRYEVEPGTKGSVEYAQRAQEAV